MKAKRVHHIGVIVDDIDAAVAFLTGTLGLEGVWMVDKPGKHKTVFFPCGGMYIEMVEFYDPQMRAARLGDAAARIEHIAIEVDDIDETYAELAAKGVKAATEGPVTIALGRIFTTRPETSAGVRYQFVELGPDAPQ